MQRQSMPGTCVLDDIPVTFIPKKRPFVMKGCSMCSILLSYLLVLIVMFKKHAACSLVQKRAGLDEEYE